MAIVDVTPFWIPGGRAGNTIVSEWSVTANDNGMFIGGQIPKDGTLSHVYFYVEDVATTGNVEVSVEGIDGTNGEPDGTLIYTGAENTSYNVSTAGWQRVALDTADTVSRGDLAGILINRTSGSAQFDFGGFGSSTYFPYNYEKDGASSYANPTRLPVFGWEYTDGDIIGGQFARKTTTNGSLFDANDSPDEYANLYSLPYTARICGAEVNVDADGDFDLILYDDADTVLQSVSIGAGIPHSSTNNAVYSVLFPSSETFDADEQFRVAIKPTHTSNRVRFYSANYDDATDRALWLNFGADSRSSRTNGGSWSEDTLKEIAMSLLIDGLDDGAGGGSGESRIPMHEVIRA